MLRSSHLSSPAFSCCTIQNGTTHTRSLHYPRPPKTGFKEVFGIDTNIDVISHHGGTDPLIAVKVMMHHGIEKQQVADVGFCSKDGGMQLGEADERTSSKQSGVGDSAAA